MELIKITNNNGKQSVSARELYEFLGYSPLQFLRWSKKNISENEFALKGQDYQGYNIMLESNRMQDYALSIDFAKRLCMMARTEKGEEARNYFIECERKAKELYKIPQTYSEALLLASQQAEKIEHQEKLLLEQKPKADFYDQIIDTDTKINMQEVAGVLNVKGYGRNNLFKFLRENEILNYKNIPYRQFIESGYFEVKERIRTIKGEDSVYLITLVTQKGIDYIRKKLEKELKK